MITTTPLLAAVEARRTQRDEEARLDEERRIAFAHSAVERRRDRWIAELKSVRSAVDALRLLGVSPDDAKITVEGSPILYGNTYLDNDIKFQVAVILTYRDAYANVVCVCDTSPRWTKHVRGVTVHELHDVILDAADDLLRHVEAQRAFGEKPVST